MKERLLILSLLVLFLLPIVFAGSVDSEMQKITHYVEEYETGNIDYVKLMLYLSSAREGLNEILGATGREIGGVVKQDQLKKILGEPNEETKWVWVEGEEHDVKLDYYVPIWKKIVFDGKKIQIRLEAFPSIFKKKSFDGEDHFAEGIEDGALIYRLHFGIEFKKPQEQLDILGKINEIQSLAEIFNANPSSSNAEALAKQSVNAERMFENYFRQNQGKCEDLMKSIFGSENQRQTQKILLNEISFFEADNFEAIMRLEMCDECEWNWINLDMHLEGRGRFKHPEDVKDLDERESRKRFEQMDENGFMLEAEELINEIKRFLELGDYGPALNYMHRLRMLNDVWNEKANNVWEQVDKTFQSEIESMTEEQRYEFDQNYGWIKQEQERRQTEKKLRQENYEKRKQFYLNLFSQYDKREYYFTQTEFEKRLVEEFRERGEEICNNNKDDNEDGAVDCDDEQCGGKICGRGTSVIQNGNETSEISGDFYCIAGTCQAREKINETQGPVCGNHICEQGEEVCTSSIIDCSNISECVGTTDCGPVYCPKDCILCPEHAPLNCSGKVIFSGEDEKGCPLEPICVEETEFCTSDLDCPQPLCGIAECIVDEKEIGECQVTELKECNQTMCSEGEKIVEKCKSGEEIVTAICGNGIWVDLHIECSVGEENCNEYCMDYISTKYFECPGYIEVSGNYPDCSCEWVCKEIVGKECVMAGDCGGENDVCSNGRCVAIPEKREVEETCPQIPISRWCPDEKTLCPMKTDAKGCSEWDCDSCEEFEEVEEHEKESPGEEEVEEPEPTPTTEPEQNSESEITGGVIFSFFRTVIGKITGASITGFIVEDEETTTEPEPVSEPEPEPTPTTEPTTEPEPEPVGECPDAGTPPETKDNCWYKERYDEQGCVSGYDVECGEWEDSGDREHGDGEWRDDDSEGERWEDEEKQRREEDERRCAEDCRRPCIEKCIRDSCGEELDCNINEEQKKCEASCKAEQDCVTKCMKGEEDWWKEFEEHEEHQMEKGVFQAGGGCRTSQGRTEGFIWFGGWGEPFEEIQNLKYKFYQGGEADWCKHDLENLIKQRKEFEKGFNQEFAQWFFEDYLANSAEDWEQHVSGIFELYWSNVDNQMQIAHRMRCLDVYDINKITSVNLINIEYETEFGSLEYWEEVKEVYMPEIDEKVTIISPYMKVWIFPPKEFIKYEMKEAMKNHEFPGPPEEKMERENEEGPTEEEKRMIKQDEKFMKKLREIAENYNGNLNAVVQFKDYETSEVVFNLYAQINENDILKIKPMLPEEVPEKDVTIEIDFEKIYDMIYSMEKEMKGEMIESPPWDRRIRPIYKVKEITNGIKMYLKVRGIVNSAKIYPEEARGDVKSLFNSFFKMMMKGGIGEDKGSPGEDRNEGEEKKIWDSKESITGEVIGQRLT